jgi:myo-inositol-1(or 4)-monophosphatase
MEEAVLRDVENKAVELARGAGEVLAGYFRRPIDVEYKGEHKANPVTAADKDAEEYLRRGIKEAFPDHGILGEEGDSLPPKNGAPLWVLDPLDGTTNFVNGLPFYAVSVGVIQSGKPVVGAIFVPSGLDADGRVFHARAGGGAFCDGESIGVSENQEPEPQRLTSLPGSFGAMFKVKNRLRQGMGEGRVAGSIAYEMALTAAGTFQYSVFGSTRIWDVAAGAVLAKEADGLVLVRTRRGWQPLSTFSDFLPGREEELAELKEWWGSLVVGNPALARLVASDLGRPLHLQHRLRMLWRRLSGQHGHHQPKEKG